jgi:hypothetical protein
MTKGAIDIKILKMAKRTHRIKPTKNKLSKSEIDMKERYHSFVSKGISFYSLLLIFLVLVLIITGHFCGLFQIPSSALYISFIIVMTIIKDMCKYVFYVKT